MSLGSGWDKLGIVGTGRRDSIRVGLGGAKLAAFAGRHPDITYGGVDRIIVRVLGGNDFVSFNGKNGTGRPTNLRGRNLAYGGSDHDVLIGSSRAHRHGRTSAETASTACCIGTAADDILHGGGGPDWIYGLSGNDDMYGGPGYDHIDGGSGTKDRCWLGLDGAAHTSCQVQ